MRRLATTTSVNVSKGVRKAPFKPVSSLRAAPGPEAWRGLLRVRCRDYRGRQSRLICQRESNPGSGAIPEPGMFFETGPARPGRRP